MENFKLEQDIKAFGVQVINFPAGISEAFDSLAKKIVNGYNRSYYGISYFNHEGKVVYNAAAKEETEGEAEQYNCERYIIKKGEYVAVPVTDWRSKTGSIKDVFHEMMQDSRTDRGSPCIEWYRSDDEMLCMIKALPETEKKGVSS